MEFRSTKELYRMFLDSDFWKLTAQRCKDAARGECRDCRRKDVRLEAHHTCYRDHWFDVRQEDLVALCDSCHESRHSTKPLPPKKRRNHKHRQDHDKIPIAWESLLNFSKKSWKKVCALRSKKLISKQEFIDYQKKYMSTVRKQRTPKWWPGMYEGKIPGQVRLEVGRSLI